MLQHNEAMQHACCWEGSCSISKSIRNFHLQKSIQGQAKLETYASQCRLNCLTNSTTSTTEGYKLWGQQEAWGADFGVNFESIIFFTDFIPENLERKISMMQKINHLFHKLFKNHWFHKWLRAERITHRHRLSDGDGLGAKLFVIADHRDRCCPMLFFVTASDQISCKMTPPSRRRHCVHFGLIRSSSTLIELNS